MKNFIYFIFLISLLGYGCSISKQTKYKQLPINISFKPKELNYINDTIKHKLILSGYELINSSDLIDLASAQSKQNFSNINKGDKVTAEEIFKRAEIGMNDDGSPVAIKLDITTFSSIHNNSEEHIDSFTIKKYPFPPSAKKMKLYPQQTFRVANIKCSNLGELFMFGIDSIMKVPF